MKKILLTILMSGAAFVSFAQQDDAGCLQKNLPLFTPFDGFYVTDYCKYSEFHAYEFTIDRGARSIKKEGIYREIWLRKKDDNTRTVSGLQILQNHARAIQAVGGEVVAESDGSVFKTTFQGKELWLYINANTYSSNLDNYGIISIQVDPMKQEVSALDIKGSMDSQGKILLYGILFETGKSDIKPESEKAINTLATYLHQNPEISVYIVGHTDNAGDFTMNQKLSKSRSESVKNRLIAQYHISATRITCDGVGSLCPVTANDTEENRALNRRVEIVKR
jgi:outer membrane protein OmpA-like peptidoglycan-associated protein